MVNTKPSPQPESAALTIQTSAVSLTLPLLTEREAVARTALEHFKEWKVDCDELYGMVGREMMKAQSELKAIETEETGFLKPLEAIRKIAVSGKNDVTNRYAMLKLYYSEIVRLFKDERQRWENIKQIEAQREADRQAAEARRIREAAEAEARARAEVAAKAAREKEEEARRQEEAAAKVKNEKKRLEMEAEAQRLRDEAEQVIITAEEENSDALAIADLTSQSSVPAATLPKMQGEINRTRWVAEFVDPMAVLKGIVDGETPMAAARTRVDGRVTPLSQVRDWSKVESIEIPLAFFSEKAHDEQGAFNYRGVIAKEVKEKALRV